MKRTTIILGAAALALMPLTSLGPTAEAGRIGGPLVGFRTTVPGTQTVWFNIEFVAGEPAIVHIAGNGRTDLDLYVYDGDGNVTMGVSTGYGVGDQKIATLNVYRTGVFRVAVHNPGRFANTFVLGSN